MVQRLGLVALGERADVAHGVRANRADTTGWERVGIGEVRVAGGLSRVWGMEIRGIRICARRSGRGRDALVRMVHGRGRVECVRACVLDLLWGRDH